MLIAEKLGNIEMSLEAALNEIHDSKLERTALHFFCLLIIYI